MVIGIFSTKFFFSISNFGWIERKRNGFFPRPIGGLDAGQVTVTSRSPAPLRHGNPQLGHSGWILRNFQFNEEINAIKYFWKKNFVEVTAGFILIVYWVH